MMCALAFVPSKDVPLRFDEFIDEVPEEFVPITEYFEVTYNCGKAARARRRAVQVRYVPAHSGINTTLYLKVQIAPIMHQKSGIIAFKH